MPKHYQWLPRGVISPSVAPCLWIFQFSFFFLQLAYSLREAVYFGVTHFVHVLCENCEKWLGPSGLWCLLGDRKRKWMNPGGFPPPHSQEGCSTGFMDLLIQQEANFKHLEEILQNKSHEFVLPMKPGWRNILRAHTTERLQLKRRPAPSPEEKEPGKGISPEAPNLGPSGFWGTLREIFS